MNKYLTYFTIVVLLFGMFGSSMLLFLFNSTSLPSDICSDCYPLSQEEIQIHNLATLVLCISALGLMVIWIINELKGK
jgi:hypothetical protein